MSTGLDFEEFCELKLTPRAGAGEVFFEAADQEREAMIPMPPHAVVNHLRSRGYDYRAESLELLVENGMVHAASLAGWSHADVDLAAVYFEDCVILTSELSMCEDSSGRLQIRVPGYVPRVTA